MRVVKRVAPPEIHSLCITAHKPGLLLVKYLFDVKQGLRPFTDFRASGALNKSFPEIRGKKLAEPLNVSAAQDFVQLFNLVAGDLPDKGR